MFDPAKTLAAARQKRSRSRRRRGKLLVAIEVDEHGLAAALIASESLSEVDALDRKRLVEELAKVVADYVKSGAVGAPDQRPRNSRCRSAEPKRSDRARLQRSCHAWPSQAGQSGTARSNPSDLTHLDTPMKPLTPADLPRYCAEVERESMLSVGRSMVGSARSTIDRTVYADEFIRRAWRNDTAARAIPKATVNPHATTGDSASGLVGLTQSILASLVPTSASCSAPIRRSPD